MARTLLVVVLGAACHQHFYSTDLVDPQSTAEPVHALPGFLRDSGGHVARAFRDRRYQLAPRFPALELGVLQTDLDRLGHLRWNARPVLHADVPVPARGAGYLDLRGSHAAA